MPGVIAIADWLAGHGRDLEAEARRIHLGSLVRVQRLGVARVTGVFAYSLEVRFRSPDVTGGFDRSVSAIGANQVAPYRPRLLRALAVHPEPQEPAR